MPKKAKIKAAKALVEREKVSASQESIRKLKTQIRERGAISRTLSTISRAGDKLASIANQQVKSRRIVRAGPRPVLDLRRRPDREGIVKQHGFKEENIGHGNLL